MTRRYSTPHTHLFRGAKLTDLDGATLPVQDRERVLIEFSDGVGAPGFIEPREDGDFLLTVYSYRTQRQTVIDGKTWSLSTTSEKDVFRVGANVISQPPTDESSAL